MPQLSKRNFVLKRGNNNNVSPLNAIKKTQNILNKDSGDIPEHETKSMKKKSRIVAGSNLLSSFTEIKNNNTELPLSQRMNEPVVKEAYIKFVQHLSQQSSLHEETLRSTPQLHKRQTDISFDFSTVGTENSSIQGSQQKMSIDSGISLSQNILNDEQVKKAYLQNRILDDEELDFMKNFKSTNKKLRVFPSYCSEKEVKIVKNRVNKKIPRNKNNPAKNKITKISTKKEKTPKKIVRVKKTEKTLPISKTCEQAPLLLYDKMVLIQESRDVGLYVLCDHCDKLRYLPDIKDPLDLPKKWYCSMNPDKNHNTCADPEEEISKEDKEYLIENEYNSGSIVWAQQVGYPWWPAMVEDDPDYEVYYWLEGSLKPVLYHVTFFDSGEVTRAWLSPTALKPFKINMDDSSFKPKKSDKFRARIDIAFAQAVKAVNMPLIERLRKYSFIERYPKGLNDLVIQSKEKKSRCKKNNINRKPQGKKLRKIISSIGWNSSDAIISDTLLNNEGSNMSLDLLDQDLF